MRHHGDGLPSLLIADGQYLAFLHFGLNGTWLGVFLAHLTPVFAYVFIVLKGPYRAFDPRYRAVSLGLNADNYRFWSVVKLAMMKPTLAAAAAVGIGVSIAQYVPTQLIASGRLTTLPIEAVTLASGGSRPLMAVFRAHAGGCPGARLSRGGARWPETPMTLLLENISLTIGDVLLVKSFTITIEAGEIVTLMGPSGSGKSSLLAYIAGDLTHPMYGNGHVTLDGVDLIYVPAEQRQVGRLFQDDLLFPHLTVGENLLFGVGRGSLKKRQHLVGEALASAQLEGFENRDPGTLSNGQRSRVALFRALMAKPQAMLLDEPFSKLDAELRHSIRNYVFAHLRERNIPTLLVTHDREDAPAGGRIFRINSKGELLLA